MSTDTILVVSHRRSGTHWIIDAIRHNFPEVSLSFLTLDRLLPWHHKGPLSLHQFNSLLIDEEGAVLIKTHMAPTLDPFQIELDLIQFVRSLLEKSKVVYVYRDGRDVLVSLYYYMRSFDSNIRDVSFSDFIRMENEFDMPNSEPGLNRVEYWMFHVEGWLRQSNVFAISYENLHRDYEWTIKQLGKYLEMQPDVVMKPIELPIRHSSSKVCKLLSRAVRMIRPQNTGSSSAILPRKGIIGDWRQHFLDEDVRFFNHIAGDLLRYLDY
jgi:hypothetical protein